MKEKVVFEHTMESILRVLGSPPPPEQSAELALLGVDLGKPLQSAYPVETYVAVMDYITRKRWPELSQEEAGQDSATSRAWATSKACSPRPWRARGPEGSR